MDVRIKHVYGRSEGAAMRYSLQHPGIPDGDDGCVRTATIFDAPSAQEALIVANSTIFPKGLISCNYDILGAGHIINEIESEVE